MNLSIEINNTEFLLDGYISSDNGGVNAAIFITIVPDINGDFCLGAYYGYAGGGENDGGFFIIDIENSIHKHVNFDEFDELYERNKLHHSILEHLMKKLWDFVDEEDNAMTLTDCGLCLEKEDGIWISDNFDGDMLADISGLWSISLRFSI
jgi:hypothetical protein